MTKPRYQTEEQILKRIDRYHIRHTVAMADRAAKVNDMNLMLRMSPDRITDHWVSVRKEGIARCDRQIAYIDRKLSRLKDKLAEFRTPLLFPGDGSVAA